MQGIKPEYLGLDSDIRGLEIYSLGPQVSIIAPGKECRGEVARKAAAKPSSTARTNLSGVGL